MKSASTPVQFDLFKAALLVLSILCFFFFLSQLWGFYHDDAYIVLRYARHFLEGKGLVWNPGERVEGYSCFLWLMLISFLGYCTIDLVTASQAAAVFFGLLVLMLPAVYQKKNVIICSLLLSTNSCFALWALGGLETIMFTFFVFAAVCLFFLRRHSPGSLFLTGVLFCLASMTRLEGLMLVTITFFFCFVYQRRDIAAGARNALYLAAGFFLIFAPYFLWRFWYFGYLFPCTYYVKGGAANIIKMLFGSRYLAHFIFLYGFPLGIVFLLKNYKAFIRDNLYLLCILLFYSVYVVSVGGDHMPGFRFLVPVLPIVYLIVARSVAYVRFQKSVAIWGVVACIVCLNFAVSYRLIAKTPQELAAFNMYKYCAPVPDTAAYYGKSVGIYIKKNWPENVLVACNTAGSTPYYSGLRFIDMLGLNDYTIARSPVAYSIDISLRQVLTSAGRNEMRARIFKQYNLWQLMPGHGKGDGLYVLSRKPDYIIVGPAQGSTKPWFKADRELLASADFLQSYRLQRVSIPAGGDYDEYFSETQTGALVFTYYERIDTAPNGL